MRASLVAALWLALSCSNNEASAPAPLVVQSRAIVDRLCACREATCAAAIEAEWNALVSQQPTRRLSADDVDALAVETRRYAKCREGR